ncbi:MAG: 2-C-methyl-D-erythritol 2,4-cyclodiphosphate synthase [Bacteroidetes bacterium]|nr:2-C-methyl-D-erythritol 2,4-cyclodiphosphate synthase [Bacteroidota bacterium]
MIIRTGFGFDVHRLEENHDFWLGGIKIPHYKGAVGHSDADTLIHAVCDALLGAAGLRDIGFHFPDTSDHFKGIDSKILLQEVTRMVVEKGYSIGNVDVTVVLQKPKIAVYIPVIQQCMAETMGIDTDQVSIKAKTSEKLGFEGREEGVSVYAIALIQKN